MKLKLVEEVEEVEEVKKVEEVEEVKDVQTVLTLSGDYLTSTFCHPEQSEGSMQINDNQRKKIFRFTQHDNKTDLLDNPISVH